MRRSFGPLPDPDKCTAKGARANGERNQTWALRSPDRNPAVAKPRAGAVDGLRPGSVFITDRASGRGSKPLAGTGETVYGGDQQAGGTAKHDERGTGSGRQAGSAQCQPDADNGPAGSDGA